MDGIRMLDPNTSRTLRIYPLETVTRWDVSFGLLLHLDQKVIVFAIYLVISFTNFYGILMQVLDSSIFAFWSKSSVDFEARRIRLKSNSYTTNTILDTVTAASVQVCIRIHDIHFLHRSVFGKFLSVLCLVFLWTNSSRKWAEVAFREVEQLLMLPNLLNNKMIGGKISLIGGT